MTNDIDEIAFPPAGWVRRDEVARLFGIAPATLNGWYRAGRIRFGKVVAKPGRGWCKIYPVAELQRVKAEMEAECGRLPDGFVRREEAARLFNLSVSGWKKWPHRGRVPAGRMVKVPGQRSLVKVFPLDALRRLRDELEQCGELRPDAEGRDAIKAQRAADEAAKRPREGMVGSYEACSMFGITIGVWREWIRKGWVRGEKFGPNSYFDKAELERLLAENGRLQPPYPDPDRPGVYRVPLCGSAMLRREAIIDAESLPLVEERRWYWSPGDLYAGYVALSDATNPVPLRRIILGVEGRDVCVRHANGDPLDCRRGNLLVRTIKELVRSNRKMGSVNGREYTSRFKGVSWETWTGKWLVQIRADGKGRKVGRFHDEIAAAEAYDEAARELFGEHARLNFPDGIDAALAREAA